MLFLIVLYYYSVNLPVYPITEMFISLFSFGRVYGRYLVLRLLCFELTIHRLMVRLQVTAEL